MNYPINNQLVEVLIVKLMEGCHAGSQSYSLNEAKPIPAEYKSSCRTCVFLCYLM